MNIIKSYLVKLLRKHIECVKDIEKNISVQAVTYPFDKRFMNFEDPKILKLMLGTEVKKQWKEAYGFDFASRDSKDMSDVLFFIFIQRQ